MRTLDLHGLYPGEALEKLELFLYNAFQKKETVVKVVYGIGTGRLREAILGVLRKHPLVRNVEIEDGSCIVIIAYF